MPHGLVQKKLAVHTKLISLCGEKKKKTTKETKPQNLDTTKPTK